MRVIWGNQLERLAEQLFQNIAAERTDPLQPVCVVTPETAWEAWLRHMFLYEWNRRKSTGHAVWANWEFFPLYQFVNDWLDRMVHPGTSHRAARLHPYSRDVLTWRLYRWLLSGAWKEQAVYERLTAYLGDDPSSRRMYELAGRLARLLEDYQVYRPEMLVRWNRGEMVDAFGQPLPDEFHWQYELWRTLHAEVPESYVSAFLRMATDINRCGIEKQYKRVHVFGLSALPPVYIHFFVALAQVLPVTLYLFNPCREQWLDDRPARRVSALPGHKTIADRPPPVGNPLLSSLGRHAQAFLAEILDRTEGQCDESFPPAPLPRQTLLQHLHADITERREPLPQAHGTGDLENGVPRRVPSVSSNDRSIQIHISHSPLRELEVLRDHMLHWFAHFPSLEPRHIQVLIPDLASYVPCIDAVFGTNDIANDQAIPYVITDCTATPLASESATFLKLVRLALPESRCRAPEVMDILECEAVRVAFGLSSGDIPTAREWIMASGIRWGLDAEDRSRTVRARFGAASWRNGLDRLLLGYAVGESHRPVTLAADDAPEPILPVDVASSGAGEILGRLVAFAKRIEHWVREVRSQSARPGRAWTHILQDLLHTFFARTPTTQRGIRALRQALDMLEALLAAGGLAETPLPLEPVAAFLEQELVRSRVGTDVFRNAVIFSPLRPMRAAPRPVICLLGLQEGAFPRTDRRPSFDLLGRQPVATDPSPASEDRLAFLEAILAARDILYLSYVGRGIQENEEIPPSTIVSELKDYLCSAFGLEPNRELSDGTRGLPLETLHHLQAFHPDYFRDNTGLFSYSRTNRAAAQSLVEASRTDTPLIRTVPPPPRILPPVPCRLSLSELKRFLTHPVRWYYQRILDVHLPRHDRTLLSDKEPLDPRETRIGADANTLRMLCSASPPDAMDVDSMREQLFTYLRASGQIPVGTAGRVGFDAFWQTLVQWLETSVPIEKCERSVCDLLFAPRETLFCTAKRRTTRLEGSVDLSAVGGMRVHVMPAHTMQANTRLQAWVNHLLLAAAGCPVWTVITSPPFFFSSSKTPGWVCYKPLSQDQALKTFDNYLRLLEKGREAPLCFAPRTSYAYVDARLRNKGEEEARKAARSEWLTHDRSRGEYNDTYLRLTFGPEGPFADTCFNAFHETAEVVLGPLLHAQVEPPSHRNKKGTSRG